MEKTIEELKIEIMMKILQENFTGSDIEKLPKNDELRTFICQFKPAYSYYYAFWVDKGPHDETRKSACRSSYEACWYSNQIDKCPRDDTRKAACKNPSDAYLYAIDIDKCAKPETREAAYKDSYYRKLYISKFGE